MATLPIESCAAIARVEVLTAEAERLGTFGDQELSYQFRQTQRRYLPDTINAFLSIPESHRDAAAQKMLPRAAPGDRAINARAAIGFGKCWPDESSG